MGGVVCVFVSSEVLFYGSFGRDHFPGAVFSGWCVGIFEEGGFQVYFGGGLSHWVLVFFSVFEFTVGRVV